MTWLIRIPDGPVVESDDFTLDDLDRIEKETGTYWSIMNPLRESKVARAFLRTAYRRADMDPAGVDTLTMRTLKGMFEYIEDASAGDDPQRPTKHRKDQKRRSSSGGAHTGSNGPPLLPVDNASGISSAS
jgi:hypothetical protein